jgi:hypothetical protein
VRGQPGPGEAGPRMGERREEASGLLGCVLKKGKEKRPGQLGRAGAEEKAGLGWAARKKREREKEKESVGRVQLGKVGEKELHSMHLNLNLKFKFKWKTNNKTNAMRHEMHKNLYFLIFLFMVKEIIINSR